MPKVDIYIETSSIFQGKTDRKCGYVLSTIIKHEEKTKEGFGHFTGTYHQAVLTVAAEAIGRVNRADECKRTMGTWLESQTRTGPEDNGISGRHC